MTLAIRKRFAGFPDLRLTLLPQFPAKAASIFAALVQEQKVTLRVNAPVTGGDDKTAGKRARVHFFVACFLNAP